MRKKKTSLGALFLPDPRWIITKKIKKQEVKIFKKLNNLMSASFLAKLAQDKLKKGEKKFHFGYCFCLTRAGAFQKILKQ